jgi:predicted nucleotidyltransferase
VFKVRERDRVREELLRRAEADAGVVGAAVTGSYVADGGDEWSDVDLALSIRGELGPALERWTRLLSEEFVAIHHWDLPWGSTVYRVFLLPDWLQVDIAFTPEADFGPRGPNWRTVFGSTVEVGMTPPRDTRELVGYAWHAVLHARICIERGKPWQAEWDIARVRENVLALACARLGYPTRFAKGADLLPRDLTAPLEETLVRSTDGAELRRALRAAAMAFAEELERADADLAAKLQPMLAELTAS